MFAELTFHALYEGASCMGVGLATDGPKNWLEASMEQVYRVNSERSFVETFLVLSRLVYSLPSGISFMPSSRK